MLSRAGARLVHGLRRRRIREEEGLFLAEGVRVVEELAASPLSLRMAAVASSLGDTPRGSALIRSLRERCEVHEVTEHELADLAATETPQGVVAVAETPRWSLQDIELPARAAVLALDAVQDPGNFGTMLRCADAFGLALVAALPGTVDPWNPKAVRAAAGASFRRPVIQIELEALTAWLREHGFALYGADMHGEPMEGIVRADRAALIVGNEGAGLGEAARAAVDRLVAVPIRGHAESLNVAVASGILLYLMTRDGA